MIHENSLLSLLRRENNSRLINKVMNGQRRADIDLILMNKWARAGFISLPGQFGPSGEEQMED
jgi:hypothetical protein